MRNVPFAFASIGLCLFVTSCVSYSGVSKAPDGQVYISGGTNYFFFSKPWVKRCVENGPQLACVELSESPPAPAASGASPTPAPASVGPAPAASDTAPAAEPAP